MLNIETLAPLYPDLYQSRVITVTRFRNEIILRRDLTATQLLTMHLFLHCALDETRNSSDSDFGPYLNILPRQFDGHPLTWRICQEEREAFRLIRACLPPSLEASLRELANSFATDWASVRTTLVRFTTFSEYQ